MNINLTKQLVAGVTLLLLVTVQSTAKNTRIVGGQNADDGEWASLASLVLNHDTTTPVCGGSLVDAQWVLTAAHCMYSGSYALQPDDLRLWIGLSNRNNTSGKEFHRIEQIIVHPSYNENTVQNDIALLKLSTSSTQPVTSVLSTVLEGQGEQGAIVGFGTTSEEGSQPSQLQEAVVPIIRSAACSSTTVYGSHYDANTMLCAGYLSGGVDSCQGDSGGPLYLRKKGGSWYQGGITSWGNGCARKNFPGVYTRVSSYRDWLTTTIGKDVSAAVETTKLDNDISDAVANNPNSSSSSGGSSGGGTEYWQANCYLLEDGRVYCKEVDGDEYVCTVTSGTIGETNITMTCNQYPSGDSKPISCKYTSEGYLCKEVSDGGGGGGGLLPLWFWGVLGLLVAYRRWN